MNKLNGLISGLYCKYKDRDVVWLVPLVVVATARILDHFFWLLRSGSGIPKCDDTTWYLNYANNLLANLQNGLDIDDTLYFGYNILLSFLLAVFRDPATVVLIQGVVAGFSVILVYKIARLLFTKTTAIIASLFYIGAWDITLWAMYLLSDSFFVSLLLLTVYSMLMALETGRRKYRLLFLATAVYLVIFRPTGIPIVAVLIPYIIYRLPRPTVVAFLARYRLPLCTTAAVIVAGGVYFYWSGALDPFFASFRYNVLKVLYTIYARGFIYDYSHPSDLHFFPNFTVDVGNSPVLSFIVNNWDHVSALYVKRAVAFLGHWVWKTDFGTISGAYNFIANFWPAALFVAGTVAAVADRRFAKAAPLWL
ncbi:MAG TPA: glycosyltransferase family 39 protein, partial [Negativicutes bacterium]|nr:glycosyltransferase family 39 protein [Negativicutes bacterium]